MRIALTYFTAAGKETCRKIEEGLTVEGHSCKIRGESAAETSLSDWTKEAFLESEALVFVSAAGIAVRAIAPFLKGKTTDPAVVVVDDRGIHVISLLSGHMGGANQLTRTISRCIGGEAVITTATDINGKFAVDEWAKAQGFYITDMTMAKRVSATLLRGERVGVYSEFPVKGTLPPELWSWEDGQACNQPDGNQRACGGPGIAVAMRRPKCRGEAASEAASEAGQSLPFDEVLWLAPKELVLGVGCRRGVSKERISEAVEAALEGAGLLPQQIKKITSIDIKKDEPGLLAYASELGVPFQVFSPEELAAAESLLASCHGTDNEADSQADKGGAPAFASSDFVKSVTGVDNVCERAAVCGCRQNGNTEGGIVRLLLKKKAKDGVTVAVAVDEVELAVKF